MVRTADAQTLGADVTAQLRAALLAGEWEPGERLMPASLAADFEVGPGVIREALTRLAADQLIISEPNRGYRVMTMDPQQIEDLLEARRINECAALRLAVERGDASWEANVVAAHHRLTILGPEATTEERAAAHHDFHLTVMAGCGNDRLVEICETLFRSSELYRQWAQRTASSPGGRNQHREHADIVKAITERDVERAVALHEQHLQRTVTLAKAYRADGATRSRRPSS